ncbi:TetR family transcriptional regulator [Streptomyces diacarni]|uniref:TetR family transcriptional regulator n=1 Tax=Streptomyces diacarni TaxID=2800381 RepID=A0A367FDT3_9ACTN|nr:TetR/AcrR family transcriptional regulator [Streptomyces diacarni]RCG28494.1 TetR family transcriptional regulator [Streptomyces diacarni]
MSDEPVLGLRERKKIDTRKALSDAAVELMYERGLKNLVREEIAARVGVSPRTFGNYFASKYEALAYRLGDRMRRSAELLRARPADEPLWTAIAEAVVEPLRADGAPFGRPTREQLVELRELNLTPQMQEAMARASIDDLVDAIAARTGTDARNDLYPRLVARVTVTAVNAVTDRYVHTDEPVNVPDLLREVLTHISEGLPPPER